MQKIPLAMRNRFASRKFYQKCCICFREGVQWHHNLIFAGKQQNDDFCILPLCPDCHEQARNKVFKEKLDWIMWNRATKAQIAIYSRAINYKYELKRLNDLFGGPWKNPVED